MNTDNYNTPVAINSKIETEEVLGELPSNWERGKWNLRTIFVDHSNKTTSWIDPRTYHLRKHDVRDIVPGELPYGWEESFDEACGVYYIDHVSKCNFLEGPWEENTRETVLRVHEELAREAAALEMQIEAEKRKQEELAAAEAKMKKLEGARLRLERELTILHTAKADMTLEDEADAEEEKRLRAELEEIEGELEQERLEFEEVAEEQANIQTEIAEFKNRLNELQVVNDRLENENTDLIDQAAATNKNLEEMRVMIEREAAQRTALEAYIKQLKNEVIELYDPDKAEQLRERQNMEDEENAGIHANGDPLPAPGEMSAEDELKELKQRLQDEKDERLRLKDLTETLEAERNRIQEDVLNEEPLNLSNLPDWIVELNVHAQKSKTLRRKIKEENPDNLEFREKVLKFTAAAIESKEKPKAPEPLAASKNMFVVKGKEVAFGAINIEQKMLAGSEIDLEDDLVGESVQIESDITIAALSAKKELDSIKRAENLKENAKNLERANELKRQEAAARVVTKQRNQAGCKIKELESKGLRIEREINRLRNRAADEDNGQEVEALREEEEQLMDELNEITDQLEQAKLEEENTE